MSNGLDSDQDQHFVGPDLGQNCLKRLSADDIICCKQGRDKAKIIGGALVFTFPKTSRVLASYNICRISLSFLMSLYTAATLPSCKQMKTLKLHTL